MTDVMGLVRAIPEATGPHYLREELPSSIDTQVSQAVRRITQLGKESRAEVANALSRAQQDALSIFAERMATHAVRSSSPEAIRDGLAALALIGNTSDVRDYLVQLPLFMHSGDLIGVDARILMHDASQIAPTELAQVMERYASGAIPSIEQMGYAEEGSGSTFRYVRV